MEENRHIFNNLTQVEKIKPKIDNPIIVEDVTYNFSDLIENEWISHFPQYSHRMRSTFVKGAGIVDEHLANINQCLIELEDELYRVYDKLSDDKKAEVTDFIQARQNEVNTFIQARKDEVASFISDRKTEVADFIKDRKNEVATFISDKQHLIDEFVQARQNEVANFIQSKTNEVSNYINQKEEQITKFIENKDNEIKRRTDTLDDYTKNLEGKIDQFNLVIQGGEATEDKLGLIRLSTISEQVQVATVKDLKKALITPNFKDITPVKWNVNITVKYCRKEKKIVADNLDKNKLDYVFNSSDYSEFANYHPQTETIKRADEEVKNVDKVIYLKLKQVTVRWHVTSEDGKINKTIEEVVATQDSTFIYRLDPSKYTELAKYCLTSDLNAVSIEPDKSEVVEGIIKLQLEQEHPELHPSPEATPIPPVPEPEPDPENPSGGGMSLDKPEEKTLKEKLLDEIKDGIIKSLPLKYKGKKYSVGILESVKFQNIGADDMIVNAELNFVGDKKHDVTLFKDSKSENAYLDVEVRDDRKRFELNFSKYNGQDDTEFLLAKVSDWSSINLLFNSIDWWKKIDEFARVKYPVIEKMEDRIISAFSNQDIGVNTEYGKVLCEWFWNLVDTIGARGKFENYGNEKGELKDFFDKMGVLIQRFSDDLVDFSILNHVSLRLLPFHIYEEIKEPDTDDEDRP